MSDLVAYLPPEQEAIRAKCFHPSRTFVEFPIEDVERSIPERFEKIVRMYPDRIAVQLGNQTWTYDALNKAANRLARSVVNRRGEKIEPIGLIADNDCHEIIAYLGILKAGKILVVINPSFPAERIAHILANSQACYLVSDNAHFELTKALAESEEHVINLDALEGNLSDVNLGLQILPDATAQILYSSGSTGQPKGVFFNHRRFLYDVRISVNAARICPDDRIAHFDKLTFGSGIKKLFRGLLSGAAIFPYEINKDGLNQLPAFLVDQAITIFSPSISTFRYLVNELNGSEQFPPIRLLMLGAGHITVSDVDAYKRIFADDCLLLHNFSSSEAGLICLYFVDKKTDIATAVVPVGYVVKDKEIYLVDENGAKIEGDEIGEIAVRSRYVSSGYWRNQELSESKFLTDPKGDDERICLTGDLGRILPDGCLVHLGRKDFVFKIRGYRVEIGEIERALISHPEVEEAGVAAWDRESEDKYLVGYIVLHPSAKLSVSGLTEFLRKKLPDYMMPSVFMFLQSLPLTNGKLDRAALPLPDHKRPNLDQPYVWPESAIEKGLVQIWEEVLNVRPIGMHDNFFDLGGHSLEATRVVSQVIKRFRLELPLQTLFESPTVAAMAAVIVEHQGKRLGEEELERMLGEIEALSDDQAQRLVVEEVTSKSERDRNE